MTRRGGDNNKSMTWLGRFVRYGLFAGLFFGALGVSLFLTSKFIVQSAEEVTVPALVGHDTVYALDTLTSLGLNLKVSGFEWSETVPKNFITFQEPAAGTRLKRDRDVKVVLSRGSRRVRVPKVVGIPLREAELVLSQNGLHLEGLCRVPSSSDPQDTVIAQSPRSLQEVARGAGVDLLVSDGPRVVARAMPELRHLKLDEALDALQRLRLAPTAVKEIYQPGEPLDVMVSQRPPAGYRVEPQVPIVLTLNRLPRKEEKPERLWWMSLLVPEGYFKKEVIVYQDMETGPVPVYRRIYPPGEQVHYLVWARSPLEAAIYVDGAPQVPDTAGFHWERLGRLHHTLGQGYFSP